MNLKFLLVLWCCVTFIACIKEDVNSLPQIENYIVSSEKILPGDTVTITLQATDADNEELQYNWSHKNGEFVSDSTSSVLYWKVPYIEGESILIVEIRDEHVKINDEIALKIEASVADDFSGVQLNRHSENGTIEYKDEAVTVTQTDENKDCIYLTELDKAIEPPYAFHIDLNTNPYVPLFTSTDKYGAYIDLWNVGVDTTIKAIWFRVYPFSSIYTWKLSVLQDQGSSNTWVDIASDLTTENNTVSKITGDINKLKIAVLADKTIQLYCNDEFLYETDAIVSQFSKDSLVPQLKLQSVGMRSSAGSVTIDNVYLSSKTDLLSTDLFK